MVRAHRNLLVRRPLLCLCLLLRGVGLTFPFACETSRHDTIISMGGEPYCGHRKAGLRFTYYVHVNDFFIPWPTIDVLTFSGAEEFDFEREEEPH